MTPRKIDFRAALDDPGALFDAPEQVLADPRLDREGKRAILRSWQRQADVPTAAAAPSAARGPASLSERLAAALAALSEPPARSGPGAGRQASAHADPPSDPGESRAPGTALTVERVMRRTAELLHPEHSLREAVRRMRRARLPFLPVAEGDEIVGILAARAVYGRPSAGQGDPAFGTVRDRMAVEFSVCYEDDDLENARALMERTGRRHLCVVDAERHLVGVLTLNRVVAGLRLQARAQRTRPG